jgi:aminobenzoyl-glutamate transport protein
MFQAVSPHPGGETVSMSVAAEAAPAKSFGQRMLDGVERLGNKVPHPAVMFFYLILIVIVLSHLLFLLGVSVTEQIAVPKVVESTPNYYEDSTYPIVVPGQEGIENAYADDFEVVEQTIPIQSLLTTEGIRFLFTSFVANFAGFGVVAVTFIAMMGAGVAEGAGLMNALIRKLVAVSPRRLLSFILIFVGVLSSVATDAGYLILVPLGAAAFASVGRHPLAGMAACFAGVGSIFGVNLLLSPSDAMITEITNEAIGVGGGQPITIVANYFFAVASSIILAIVAYVITERLIEPRLGAWHAETTEETEASDSDPAAESRGLGFALVAFLAMLAVILLITVPSGAPLREPETGDIIGATPFMDSLLFIIAMFFLVAGIGYGIGARTFKSSTDVAAAVTKTFAGLGGLVFMLLMIAQFIAFFNYSQIPNVLAIRLAEVLEQAGIGAIPLLIGMIIVIAVLDIIMPGLVPKWAIFAPIFVPLFIQLGIAPQTVLAAYRVGDSPLNTVTPLMVYLPFVVTIAQRYQKDAGIGTIIALMLPYAVILLVVWILLFIVWYVLGLPLGPGYPVTI